MLTRKSEDYLKAILNFTEKKGYARTKDLAKEIGVRPPSVTEMLSKLSSQGLVIYEKYGGARLSPQGLHIAKKIKKRHEVFEKFLKVIIVPGEIASKDACKMEHHLHPETIKRLSEFMNFLSKRFQIQEFSKEFERFCNSTKK